MKVQRARSLSFRLSPWVSLILLIALAAFLPSRTMGREEAAARQLEMRQAIESTPRFIGRWIGEDAPVPQEAQELLRPNAILSRTYRRPGQPQLHVVLVHCSDSRDMIGHYPPVCYPAAGYISDDSIGTTALDVDTAFGALPVRLYQFRRMRGPGRQDAIRIFNAFVLPDGTVTRDLDDIKQQSERLAVAVQGVAQLQVISAANAPLDQTRSAAGELLSGMREMFTTLGVGKSGEL